MKTAMQQMIDIVENQINNLSKEEPTYRVEGALFALRNRLIDAEELLEVEKQQIKKAWNVGLRQGAFEDLGFNTAEQYYQQTFKSDE